MVILGLLAVASAAAVEAAREVRHQVVVASPVARAWWAWTTNEGLQAFFPGIRPGGTNVRLEPGGPYEFEFLPDQPPGARGCDRCVILAYQPERMLSFTWDHRPDMAVRGQMTHVVVRFEALGAAETRVTLVQDGWGDGPQWDESYRYFDSAWHAVLERLQAYLADPKSADSPAVERGSQKPEAGAAGPDAVDVPRHELIFAHHTDAARTDYDIWRMCGDGTQMASLVREPGQQLQIAVSPDGDELIYSSVTDGQRDLWRRRFDSKDAVNITSHPAEDSQPAWGPDGRIAFFSDRDAEELELYILDTRDSSLRRMTENAFHDSGAAWAPDGSGIVFTRYFPPPEGEDHGGRGEVIHLDPTTGQEYQMTRLGGYNGGLSCSPDGRFITFHRTFDGGSELWIMDADGSNPTPLTDTTIDEYSPEWSPDGEWIAFTAGVGNDSLGTFDIWIMRPDGSRRQVLNKTANTEGWQKWRPGDHYCR
jgi:TolB protein